MAVLHQLVLRLERRLDALGPVAGPVASVASVVRRGARARLVRHARLVRTVWPALAGAGALAVGGYLVRHRSKLRGGKVHHAALERRPQDWTPVLAAAELADGQHRKVQAGDTAVLLHREGDRVRALTSMCGRMGGPSEEGEIADSCVTCPWHGSVFDLCNGGGVRGSASTPRPGYETRIRGGRIEVRALR